MDVAICMALVKLARVMEARGHHNDNVLDAVAYLANNGGTAYYQTAVQIDGFGRTVKYQGGSAPSSGNANSIDIYSITLLKTAANTWTVLASQTQYA